MSFLPKDTQGGLSSRRLSSVPASSGFLPVLPVEAIQQALIKSPAARPPRKSRRGVLRVVEALSEEDLAFRQTGLWRRYEEVAATRWKNMRTTAQTCGDAVRSLRDLHDMFGATEIAEVTKPQIVALVNEWQKRELSTGSIWRRLATLNSLGIKVQGCRPTKRPTLKWWLNPNDKEKILAWLLSDTVKPERSPEKAALCRDLADHIEWTCYTGFRVEETMRLRWREVQMFGPDGQIDPDKMSVTVPGLKTFGSHATLPLGRPAAKVYLRRWYDEAVRTGSPPRPDGHVFCTDYLPLRHLWNECRKLIGAEDAATCTLKALRRSAARYLHVEQGMPLDVVRQYLRHGDIQTTMGYLRLVGGYQTEEMRRWLRVNPADPPRP